MLLLSLIRLITAELSLSTGVEEIKKEEFNYEPEVFNEHIGLVNVIVKSHILSMRSNAGESSMVRWNKPNETKNWAFSFKVTEPNLASNEFAGIYLYYTEKETTTGAFNGANENFNGYLFGLEMKGKSSDIVFGKNDGSNFLDKADYAIRRDSLNPQRFKGVKEITFKAIATEKNIKVELFGDDKLIYDGFKIPLSFGAHEPGKYFGIIADYKDAPSNKSFVLKRAQLYSRNEFESYNVYEMKMEKIEPQLRDKSKIKHPDTDIREIIHKAELAEHLVKYSVGDLPRTKILMAKEELEKDIKQLADKLELLSKMKKRSKRADLSTRLNEFEIKLNQVLRTVHSLDYIVTSVATKQLNNQSNLQYVAFVVGIIGVSLFVYREVVSFTSKSN